MKPEDAIWILELIRNRDARTDAEKDAVNAAIEALKAQLSKESTTSDLISRQAAIDLVTDMEFMNFTAKGILRDSLRKLSPAQPELNLENLVRMIEFGITATNSRDAYSLGMRNGMRWCKSLIDGMEPKFEEMSVDNGKELPTIQPEPQEGHWIRRDCGLDVECKCSRCGYKDFVEPRDEYWFNRNFCPNCGAKMKGAKHEGN